eukprot:6378814-Prymnesium_polylepis.2
MSRVERMQPKWTKQAERAALLVAGCGRRTQGKRTDEASRRASLQSANLWWWIGCDADDGAQRQLFL